MKPDTLIGRRARTLACVAALGPLLAAGCGDRPHPVQFRVSLPASEKAAFDGRLLIMLSRDPSREPRLQISQDVRTTQQIFGVTIDGLKPDRVATLDATAIGYPTTKLTDIPPGEYTVQALLNVYETFKRQDGRVIKAPMDQWEGQKWSIKPGNLYSEPRRLWIDPASSGAIEISLDRKIPALPYPKETEFVKYVRIESKLLSAFWGRKFELGAFVLLPAGFDAHPEARYPLVVNPAHFPTEFPIFSESIPDPTVKGLERINQDGGYQLYQDWKNGRTPRMLVMAFQHATPFYDDSYGVNSANNGPFGDAITQELIPYIEQRFRGIGQPWARALHGCSTGGWEALGMQILHPDFYGGTWAGAPSPIDFRAWRLVNLYQDKNAYWYSGPWGLIPRPSVAYPGSREVPPADRMEDGHLRMTMEQDNHLELVIGDKGRGAGLWDGMQSVFGPVGPDGYPAQIWDKLTGEIDPAVAAYWREHADLRHILERDWAMLGPKLKGRINLVTGTSDEWYLANAVRYMEQFLESTKDPYYEGHVGYGTRYIHCYTGDSANPLTVRTFYQRVLPEMAAHMRRVAPRGADVASWSY